MGYSSVHGSWKGEVQYLRHSRADTTSNRTRGSSLAFTAQACKGYRRLPLNLLASVHTLYNPVIAREILTSAIPSGFVRYSKRTPSSPPLPPHHDAVLAPPPGGIPTLLAIGRGTSSISIKLHHGRQTKQKARVTTYYAGYLFSSSMVGPPGLEPGTIRL